MDERDVPGVLGRSITTPMDSADKIFDLRRPGTTPDTAGTSRWTARIRFLTCDGMTTLE